MKGFVYQSVERITGNWHDGGGVFVVAEDREHAERLVAEHRPKRGKLPPIGEPEAVFDLAGEPLPQVFIFPDAGCC